MRAPKAWVSRDITKVLTIPYPLITWAFEVRIHKHNQVQQKPTVKSPPGSSSTFDLEPHASLRSSRGRG